MLNLSAGQTIGFALMPNGDGSYDLKTDSTTLHGEAHRQGHGNRFQKVWDNLEDGMYYTVGPSGRPNPGTKNYTIRDYWNP